VSLRIRALREADLDAADAIVRAAYDVRYSRRAELRRYLRLQPDGWLFALLDEQPAGVVGAMDYGPFASVGMMGVHPSMQRRGIARALLEHLLAWLDARGCPLAILDASEAGAPLYPQYGFADRGRAILLRHEAQAMSAQHADVTPARADVAPVRAGELPALAAFDAPIFGADRAAVLASYHADHPDRVLALRDGRRAIQGYIVVRHTQLGPWVARTPDVAAALLSAALALPFERPPTAIVPGEAHAALELLQGAGFVTQRALRHMWRGAHARPGRRDLLYAQASFALG
jgi:GNAT superfamily N-acetyltransferase